MVLGSGFAAANPRSPIRDNVATASGDALNQLRPCAITGWRKLLVSLGQSPLTNHCQILFWIGTN
jgi:hypothetical protein